MSAYVVQKQQKFMHEKLLDLSDFQNVCNCTVIPHALTLERITSEFVLFYPEIQNQYMRYQFLWSYERALLCTSHSHVNVSVLATVLSKNIV